MSVRIRANNTASTKRAVVASGKRQNPTTNLTGLKHTNLWPADPSRLGSLVEAGVLQGIVNIFETIVVGNHDIRPGDILVTAASTGVETEYVIRGASAWDYPTGAGYFSHLTMEKVLQ